MLNQSPIMYACGCVFSPSGNQVLTILKNRGPAWIKDRLNFPGGAMLPNEDPIAAVIRELKEETNLDSVREDWSLFAMTTTPNALIYFATMTPNNMQQWLRLKSLTDEPTRFLFLPLSLLERNQTTFDLPLLIELARTPQFSRPILLTLDQDPT